MVKTVLVVDDEPIVLKMVNKGLTREGFRVLEAPDGSSALRICASEHGAVDLILTDIDMPGIDGRELARCIGQHHSGVPVLFMTGQRLETKTRATFAGAPELDGNEIIWKPFRMDQLTSAVRRLLSD